MSAFFKGALSNVLRGAGGAFVLVRLLARREWGGGGGAARCACLVCRLCVGRVT